MNISAEFVFDKMPYLGEDEHTTDVKSAAMATSNSTTSDAEDVEMNVEIKVSDTSQTNKKIKNGFHRNKSIAVILIG